MSLYLFSGQTEYNLLKNEVLSRYSSRHCGQIIALLCQNWTSLLIYDFIIRMMNSSMLSTKKHVFITNFEGWKRPSAHINRTQTCLHEKTINQRPIIRFPIQKNSSVECNESNYIFVGCLSQLLITIRVRFFFALSFIKSWTMHQHCNLEMVLAITSNLFCNK